MKTCAHTKNYNSLPKEETFPQGNILCRIHKADNIQTEGDNNEKNKNINSP